jgi:hypothetical protein
VEVIFWLQVANAVGKQRRKLKNGAISDFSFSILLNVLDDVRGSECMLNSVALWN